MPMYTVITPLRDGGKKPIPPGRTVELDAAEGDPLVAIGALEPAAPKPLGRMSKAQLAEIGAAEGIQFPENATQAQMVEAIERSRAAVD